MRLAEKLIMDPRSTSPGMIRRLGRLFDERNGRSIIVAMDHGIGGTPDGFRHPGKLLEVVLKARPDGILLNAGLARRFAPLFARRDAPALVLGIDMVHFSELRGKGSAETHAPQIAVEEAVRLGADAVKAILVMGWDSGRLAQNMQFLAKAAERCRHWELPLMIEPGLWGGDVSTDPAARAEMNADGARMAVELGADILKLQYGGDPRAFGEIVDASPVPVLILGGPKRPTQRETLADVVAAAEAGAVGVVMGRNVWQHDNPGTMVRAIRTAVVSRDLEAALAELSRE
jgi:fructose-bisphosphate aldolase, class I